MKRIAALFLFLSAGILTVNAQPNERTNAYLGMTHYQKDKDPAELAKAKIAIDKATVHPDTKDDVKTWTYRGQIYLLVYQKEFADKLATHKDVTDPGKKSSMSYLETPTANLQESVNALLKARTMDTKKVYSDDIARALGDCYFYLQNSGISRFNQKMYPEAMPMFELAADVVASNGKFDTLNTNNAASSAYNGKMYDKAIPLYKKLTEVGYGKGNTWMMLGRVYAESGDSANYISTISAGLKKYPNDADLLTEDVNVKIQHGQVTAAVDELNALIQQKPNDPQLNLIVGQVYDHIANPTGSDGKSAPKPKNYEEMFGKAVQYYKKAIELEPTNFDANYCLGVLYYNQAVDYYNLSQETIADAAKYKDLWEKPLPDAAKYLEAAHALQPKDLTTLEVLKKVYSQMSDDVNYTRIKEEIKKVQAGQ